jgi:hypothetical protein
MKLYGTTVKEIIEALGGGTAGGKRVSAKDKKDALGVLILSVIFSFGGFFLIVWDQHNSQGIGAGILGAVVGYWLK